MCLSSCNTINGVAAMVGFEASAVDVDRLMQHKIIHYDTIKKRIKKSRKVSKS